MSCSKNQVILQTYVRTHNQKVADYVKISKSAWYPISRTNIGICGQLVNNKGEVYTVDMEVIEYNTNWEVKIVEVIL